jgi:3-deoxy-D-manno-octulosonate 8-phosphate phosphatase (KDO 8-P phosphatase)
VGANGGQLDARRTRILAGVRLLVLDVDGTLTDGRVVYAEGDGEVHEVQAFHVHDGQGLSWLVQAGVAVVWISGRGSEATRRRAGELGVAELHLGVADKGAALADVQARLGLAPEHTAAMGDDLGDLALKQRAAFFAAPADARAEVRGAADLVTAAGGGRGAVRELVEAILAARGRWPWIADAPGE